MEGLALLRQDEDDLVGFLPFLRAGIVIVLVLVGRELGHDPLGPVLTEPSEADFDVAEVSGVQALVRVHVVAAVHSTLELSPLPVGRLNEHHRPDALGVRRWV